MELYLAGIRNIIFDLGGVLFAVDYQRTAMAFQKLGLRNFDQLYSQAKQSNLFDQLETGQISAGTFRLFIRENASGHLTDDAIDEAWCAMLIGMPAYKFATLKQLAAQYRLFLLSNTNEIHLPDVRAMIQKQTPGFTLEQHFEKCYYSHEIKMRKPNADIFNHVINENALIASETLFLDDSVQHVEGANICGIQALLISEEFTTENLKELLL